MLLRTLQALTCQHLYLQRIIGNRENKLMKFPDLKVLSVIPDVMSMGQMRKQQPFSFFSAQKGSRDSHSVSWTELTLFESQVVNRWKKRKTQKYFSLGLMPCLLMLLERLKTYKFHVLI